MPVCARIRATIPNGKAASGWPRMPAWICRGYTTVGMSECVNSEYQFWDRRLNQTYQTVLSDAEKMDQEMADLGSAAEKQVPYLREMQRNWIAYRDAACQFERSRWGGGTGGGPASANCMLRLTADQVFWLQQYTRNDQGG